MEKMLFGLNIIQLLISIYWLLNGIFFYEAQKVCELIYLCPLNSLFSIFSNSLFFIFFICAFHNLMTILNNPIDGILKFNNRLLKYLSITIILSFLYTLIAKLTKVHGFSVIFF